MITTESGEPCYGRSEQRVSGKSDTTVPLETSCKKIKADFKSLFYSCDLASTL